MLELVNLSKDFRGAVAVADVSLRVEPGTLFSIVGPNGAGKTSTIKMICGLLRPSAGRCSVFGHDVNRASREAKALMSYVPDQPYIYHKLTGLEFLEMVGRMYGMGRRRLSERLAEMVDLMELHDFAEDLVERYSHGMKQRTVLAAALIHEPRLILIDEPMVGLDPKNIRRIKRVLREFSEAGNIVFMSTHTLADVEEMSDQVGVLRDGRLIAEGSVDDVKRQANAMGFEESFLALTGGAEDA